MGKERRKFQKDLRQWYKFVRKRKIIFQRGLKLWYRISHRKYRYLYKDISVWVNSGSPSRFKIWRDFWRVTNY